MAKEPQVTISLCSWFQKTREASGYGWKPVGNGATLPWEMQLGMPPKIFPNVEEDGWGHRDSSGIERVEWESHGKGSWPLLQTQQREASSLSKARVGHTAAGWTHYSHGHHVVGTPPGRQRRQTGCRTGFQKQGRLQAWLEGSVME